jgi:hypothetical protein
MLAGLGNGSVRTILLGRDLNKSNMFTPYSEDISKITNLTLGTEFIAFLITKDVRLLLPDPVKANAPTW